MGLYNEITDQNEILIGLNSVKFYFVIHYVGKINLQDPDYPQELHYWQTISKWRISKDTKGKWNRFYEAFHKHPMSGSKEKLVVFNRIIEYAQDQGWAYINRYNGI